MQVQVVGPVRQKLHGGIEILGTNSAYLHFTICARRRSRAACWIEDVKGSRDPGTGVAVNLRRAYRHFRWKHAKSPASATWHADGERDNDGGNMGLGTQSGCRHHDSPTAQIDGFGMPPPLLPRGSPPASAARFPPSSSGRRGPGVAGGWRRGDPGRSSERARRKGRGCRRARGRSRLRCRVG